VNDPPPSNVKNESRVLDLEVIDANTGYNRSCRARFACRDGGDRARPVLHLYGWPSTNSWSPYNYPGYQSYSATPWYYYYPGYGYAYNYPTYNYYAGSPYAAPKAYWDPYVGLRPYSDNAGPKASGHGSP